MGRQLLVVALPDKSHYPRETHLLLSHRLVLLAISDTKALDISFWGCPEIAKSFDCESSEEWPDLLSQNALSVLGRPEWLQAESTPWTQWLIHNESLTSYTKTRVRSPVSRHAMALVGAGISLSIATKLLEQMSFNDLRQEADLVIEGLKKKLKISNLTTTFKRRKDVEGVLSAEPVEAVALERTPIVKMWLPSETEGGNVRGQPGPIAEGENHGRNTGRKRERNA